MVDFGLADEVSAAWRRRFELGPVLPPGPLPLRFYRIREKKQLLKGVLCPYR
jgi:hypothetical protein